MRQIPAAATLYLALVMPALVMPVLVMPALAQSDLDTEIAKKHYELGAKLYQASRYKKAVVQFKKAYDLSPRPDLLFNIARCYEVGAELRQAIDYYQRYLKKAPQATNANLVRVRLKSLEARLSEQNAGRAKTSRATPHKPIPTAATAHGETDSPSSSGGFKSTAGWISVGVGVAALATGLVFGAMAQSKSDDYATGVTQKKDFAELDAIDGDGKRYETIQVLSLVVGSVAVAAGGALLVWRSFGNASEGASASLIPFFDSHAVGIGATGRF